MDNHNDGHEPGMGPDIDLLYSDLQIVQDVEEDLEEYTRLVRLGRFGEASKLFRETLHRHLGCFAVLAEHCNALLYQGDYARAYLVLKDAIARQEASATGSVRFETSEVHFLRVFLTYVKIFAEKDRYIGRREARSALSQARWYRNSITATDPRELMDVERQILLTCLRIFVVLEEDNFASIEDLQLPWSSPPSYPGETLKLSVDYLAWFEILLPKYPWDACIVLQGISLLRWRGGDSLDYPAMIDMVERNFPDTDPADIILFIRMLLLGKLCEISLTERWVMPGLPEEDHDLNGIRIVVDPDSERLAELIQSIVRQYSGANVVTQTRPYKYLQLLVINHEMIREHRAETTRKIVSRILSRLNAIEKYAASSETLDHQLAMDVIYHQYVFQPRQGWRRTMLKKIAHFASRFGNTQESIRLHASITYNEDLFSTICNPTRTYLVLDILRLSELIKDIKDHRSGRPVSEDSSQKRQSIFENLLLSLGEQEPQEALAHARSEQYALLEHPKIQPTSYGESYVTNYSNPHTASYGNVYTGQLQPATVTTSNQPYSAPSYPMPPLASAYPAPEPYLPPPRQKDQKNPYSSGQPFEGAPTSFDTRYAARTKADPDTTQLPEHPKEKAQSSIRGQHGSDDSDEAYDSDE